MSGGFHLLSTIVIVQLIHNIHVHGAEIVPCKISGQYLKTVDTKAVTINGQTVTLTCIRNPNGDNIDCLASCFLVGVFRMKCIVGTKQWSPPLQEICTTRDEIAIEKTIPTKEQETSSDSESVGPNKTYILVGIVGIAVIVICICACCWTAKLKRHNGWDNTHAINTRTHSMIFAATLPYGPGAALQQSADTLSSSINRGMVDTSEHQPPYTCNMDITVAPPPYSEVMAAKQGTIGENDSPPPYTDITYSVSNNK